MIRCCLYDYDVGLVILEGARAVSRVPLRKDLVSVSTPGGPWTDE
jgi:hypothetical protein